MFHKESYSRHEEWYNQHFPTKESKVAYYHKIKSAGTGNIGSWLQQIFFSCLDPLLKEQNQSWLTIGDAYGFDAQYIISRGSQAMATDLNTDFLSVAAEQGIVSAYAAENAEKLSFADNQFDYVLCKESYHHFPRPYAALYEMMRVAGKGIIIIEPQDPVSKMPLLLFLTNLLAFNPALVRMIWKNRFSFEPVGNFIYKVSEREFEKFAGGLNLPALAFKKINPNFYFKGAEHMEANVKNSKFLSIRLKKLVSDILVKCKLKPAQVLATLVFKEIPALPVADELRKQGYQLINIPANPYVK